MTEQQETTKEIQQTPLRSDKMRVAPVGRLMFSMSLPAIISMLVQALYNIVDSVFVSNIRETVVGQYAGDAAFLGDDCFLAVSVAYPMAMIVISLGIAIGVGANAYIARKLGEGKRERASFAAKTAIVMSFAVWLLMVVLAFTAARPFVRFFINENNCKDPAFVAEQGSLYLIVYLAGSLFSLLEMTGNRILQATGNMKVPMISQLVGAVTNILLDALFILVFKTGVLGAVVATIIGQFAACVVVLFNLIFKKQDVDISLKGFRPEWSYVSRISKVGLPAFIMNAMGSVITVVFNIWLKDTQTGIYVLSAYFKVQSFVFMPVFGLMQGTMPILSYNYGANLKKRFNGTFLRALAVSVGVLGVGTVLFQTIPQYIMRILSDDPQIIADGVYAFRVISICFVPAAFSIVVINMLQSLNRPLSSLLMSLCRQLLFLLPVAFLLNTLYGQAGIWFAYPIAEVGALLIFLPISFAAYKKQFAYKQKQYDEKQLQTAS